MKKLVLIGFLIIVYPAFLFGSNLSKEKYNNSIDTLDTKLYPQFKPTYIELLKKIFYKIQKNQDGDLIALGTISIRNVFGLYPKTSFADTVRISIQNKMLIKSSGKSLLLLICDANFTSGEHPLGEIASGVTVMGLFDPTSGQLLDAVDLASDRWTELGEVKSKYTLPLSRRQEAVAVWNTHNNSSQGYNACNLFCVVNNKIKEVFSFFILNYRSQCEEFVAEPYYIFSKNNGKLFGDVYITIKGKIIKNQEEGCAGKKRTIIKNYKAHLIWNNKKKTYINQLKDFDILDKQNEANF